MKILLVEDEESILSFLEQGLSEEGYEVDTAKDGERGLDKALDQSHNLIIMDWMLPKMEGPDICEKIRSKGIHTPIIFLTAKDELEDTIMGLQAGANDYIKKPFHFEELLERIKVQLRNKEEDLKELSFGSIRIDPNTHQVFKDDNGVKLTQREYELLYYLIAHQGTVCERDQIIKDVWNIHFDYDSGIIDVYINSLRKKLSLKGADDHIHTIRGVGYIVR
jgi:DNA-binding response OmpR family regulator